MAWPTQAQVDAYVAARAPLYSIDPSIAVRVRQSESATGWVGDNGTSFGPFQLHYGGGLGDVFTEKTGLDARDSRTWQAQVDFALADAQKNGWHAFKGARRVGIGVWDGIRAAATSVGKVLTYYFPIVGYSGNVRETYHTPGAVDLFAAAGTLIRNMVNGRVVSVGDSGAGGNSVLIKGEDGRDYYYAHMRDRPSVNVGDYVPGGATIGKVGETGNAKGTGAHLHLGSGYGISTGTGASGGAGLNFDFQSFVAGILDAGGSDARPVQDVIADIDPSQFTSGLTGAIGGTLKSVHQGITNYVQDRAASIVLLGIGILMIIGGIFAWATQSPTVRNVVKAGAGMASPVAGAAAAVAL